MKIVQINQVSGYGSTGRIAEDLSHIMLQNGIENKILYGVGSTACPNAMRFGTEREHIQHKLLARATGHHGAGSLQATRQMVDFLREYQPDLVHLHNLHGFYLNLPCLFQYLKQAKVPVVWTLHDCWAFTGHCAYFSFAQCQRWQSGCGHCPQRFAYPRAVRDRSRQNWLEKRELFTGLERCVLVSPSRWLAGLVQSSFLGEYPVKVIPNGIDLEVFYPHATQANAKKIVLACVSTINPEDRKGGRYLPQLAARLGDAYEVQVLGLRDRIVPPNIHALPYLKDKAELAAAYSKADVLVNPTLEDNFPTVNLEALACGTPVVTFDTGGSPECLGESCGAVVPQGDVDALAQAAKEWAAKDAAQDCRNRAMQYSKAEKFGEYIQLYQRMTGPEYVECREEKASNDTNGTQNPCLGRENIYAERNQL